MATWSVMLCIVLSHITGTVLGGDHLQALGRSPGSSAHPATAERDANSRSSPVVVGNLGSDVAYGSGDIDKIVESARWVSALSDSTGPGSGKDDKQDVYRERIMAWLTRPSRSPGVRLPTNALPTPVLSRPVPISSMSDWSDSGKPASSPLADIRALQRKAQRERTRKLRIERVRARILKSLGKDQEAPRRFDKPSEERWALTNTLRQQFLPESAFASERRCYSPSCPPSRSVEASLWHDNAQPNLRLYFPLPKLDRKKGDRKRGKMEDVVKATLDLYFKPQPGCPCVDTYGSQIPGYVVTVNQFRKLKIAKGRVVNRTTEIDRLEVPLGGNVRFSIDVLNTVRWWMNRPKRNLGFEIRVRSLNGTAVNARSLLAAPPSCETENKGGWSCSDRPGERIELLPWPDTSFDRVLSQSQARPLLNIKIVDRNRPSAHAPSGESELVRGLGQHSLNLGNLENWRRKNDR